MRVLLVIFAVLMLFGCGKSSELRQDWPATAIEIPGPASNFKPMTNDEIINETKKCEAAGLSAESLKVTQFGAQTVLIQCQPIQHKEIK